MSLTYINELLSSPTTSELFNNPSYPLYLPVEVLTKAAEKKRTSKRAPYVIPRPPNPSPTTSELFNNPSYPLYLPVEVLTKAAEKKRTSKRAPYVIPRPPNPFFIFRRNYTAKMKQEKEKSSTSDTSRNVGHIWREQNHKVKKLFQALSLLAKRNHFLKYPDYKYNPDKSKKIKGELTFCHVDPENDKNDKNNKKDKNKKVNQEDYDSNNENDGNNEENEDNEEGGRSSTIVLEEIKNNNSNNSVSETMLIQSFNSFQFFPYTTNTIINISDSTMNTDYLCSPPSFYIDSELNNCSDDFADFFLSRNYP
ncbi:hypothetical protein Glove_212g168 [Diversispora epigaea]|uniref:HMG box domain-containing protein n=1 Tax=Diversispora epigaea TaxID=1348612 RepID=A0A397ILA0_9GLOM|nr:hypothetical protein Glove_212g168 [Diversispora epigaea]